MNFRKPTILLTGSTGLLGGHLITRLIGQYNVTTIGRHAPPAGISAGARFKSIDFVNQDAIRQFLVQNSFDVIVNCAALADVDLCETERELALTVNVEAVGTMARHSKENGTLLIQISTDYIFDGASGPYSEDDAPNPVNYYGRTKLMAEETIGKSGCEHIIVRTNHLYGNGENGPSKQIRWLLDVGNRNDKVLAADDLLSNPTWAGNLADGIALLASTKFRGIINIGGCDYLSRYDFALLTADIMRLDRNMIQRASYRDLGMTATRPPMAGLKIDRMKTLLKLKPVGIEEGLKKVRAGTR